MRQIEKQTRTDGENKMGVMPVNRLLVTMALPIMISMIIQAMYNIVDSLFVARISEQALTAVSLAYSVQNLLIGVAVGTGVGVNSLLSRYLGEQNREGVNKTAVNGISLCWLPICSSWCLGCFSPGRFSNYRQIQKKS